MQGQDGDKPSGERWLTFRTTLQLIARLLLLLDYTGLISSANAFADAVPHQVLAFYYGWYGNPQVSGHWVHWKNVDPEQRRIENATDYPAYGTL
jgi:hypothetical protein